MVKQVQSKLRDDGYYKQGAVDGVWGSGTEYAVRSFQHDHNLSSNGQLDVPTLQALNVSGVGSEAAPSHPPETMLSRHNRCRLIQTCRPPPAPQGRQSIRRRHHALTYATGPGPFMPGPVSGIFTIFHLTIALLTQFRLDFALFVSSACILHGLRNSCALCKRSL